MPRRDADRNLLLGINALQNGFITKDALITAMKAWVLVRDRTIGEILVQRGAMKPDDRLLLERLVDRHVELHDNDPAVSLAAMSSLESLASEIRRSITDPEVLESLAQAADADPHATRYSDDETDPYATRHSAPDAEADSRAIGSSNRPDSTHPTVRYQKVRNHAQGGLGVVYVARDQELNREVALKEIKTRYADNPSSQARFMVEAEITGGLEHPGIVPVYGLGHYHDGRPFYAMRFIKGDSLKESIGAFHADATLKTDPGARTLALQKLLRRFLDVCNAVEYAHSRGVLHRDLKPDNVMVGKYGETLVVDWGLAKSIGRSGDDGEGSKVESPLYSTSGGSVETMHGAVVGTPAYMSPEQAAGRLDLLGGASDVYGLGATLYALLTGQAPISGGDLTEILRKVEAGEVSPPRQVTPWLDPALNAICVKAMALKPTSRYASPRALADDIDRWIAGEAVLAYPEPWTRRARRWARKHRTGLVTTASTLAVAAVLLAIVAGWRIAEQRKNEASARVNLVKADASAIRARTTGLLADWDQAITEARLAENSLKAGGSAGFRREVEARLASFRAEQGLRGEALEADRRDRQVVTDLEEAKLRGAAEKEGLFDLKAKIDSYGAALRTYGIDVETLPIAEAATRVRRSRVTDDLITALDDWARYPLKNVSAEKLSSIARAAETDPIRLSIRDAIQRRDIAALRGLCATEEARRKLGSRIFQVFTALLQLDAGPSVALLESILVENPADFWMNHDFGVAFRKSKAERGAEALRHLTAAVALRPQSAGAHLNFGVVLSDQGRVDAAIVEFRQAIRINPNYVKAHNNYGCTLSDQGLVDAAMVEFREAIRINPDDAMSRYNLGLALRRQGQVDAAIAEYRQAIRINPDFPDAHNNLGFALSSQGKVDAAIAEFRQAIRINPNDVGTYLNLGVALIGQGKVDAAIAEFRQAILIKPDYVDGHNNLGYALKARGQIDEAITEYRHSIRINPDSSVAHFALAVILLGRDQLEPAIAELREVIRINPRHAEAYCNLGLTLQDLGRFREALDSLEKAHAYGSIRKDWRQPTERWVNKARRLVELDIKLTAVLKGEVAAGDADDRASLADLCAMKKMYATAARFWTEAFTERPAMVEDVASGKSYKAACSAALAGSGKGMDEPPVDESGRAKLRAKALAWLKADLALYSKAFDEGKPADRKIVAKTIADWQVDADLAGLRDEASLALLPEEERAALRALWEDVGRLLARTREAPNP